MILILINFKETRTIKIYETQLGQDALVVDIDLMCGCDCNANDYMSTLKTVCPTNSHLSCGICECDKGW